MVCTKNFSVVRVKTNTKFYGFFYTVIFEKNEIIPTPVMLRCLFIFFNHSQLEFLAQFPASNKQKYDYLWKLKSITNNFINMSVILFVLKHAWNIC